MAQICDFYSESNYSGWSIIGGMGTTHLTDIAQSFTGNGKILNSVKFYCGREGNPSGNIYAHIYAHSGTFGISSLPTGDSLAISNPVDVSTINYSQPNELKTFIFSGINNITLINEIKYVVVFKYEGGDGDNFIMYGFDNSSSTHEGNISSTNPFNGKWYADSADDLCFYVYTNESIISPFPSFFRP